jgi:transcriptional regulator with XRE-family HTH domain
MNDVEKNKRILAANLTRYLKLKNIDRNQLCADLGIKYSTLSDWLNARKYPRIDKIEMLANYFHIEKSDLIEFPAPFVPPYAGAPTPEEQEAWELKELQEQLHKTPGMRTLFSLAKNATPEDLKLVEDMLKRMKKDSGFDGPED